MWTAAAVAADRLAGPAERPAGSGVIVHSDGYILTAQHVIANARRVIVVTSGEVRAAAIVVSTDPEHDLALLKAETVGLTEAALGHAGGVRLDQEVVAVGFPFGLREVSVTRGRIAAVRTKGVQRVFQVDAAINPGNSGGPLYNTQGELIGILTTKFSHPSGIVPEGMAFAVPVSYATPLLANIEGFDFSMVGKGRNGRKAKRGRPRSRIALPTWSSGRPSESKLPVVRRLHRPSCRLRPTPSNGPRSPRHPSLSRREKAALPGTPLRTRRRFSKSTSSSGWSSRNSCSD